MPFSISNSSRALFCAGALLLACIVCPAQETRGSITGKVTDPSGAVVPGAAVVVTNTATNVASRAATNETGYYEVNFLVPGPYSVSAETKGFKNNSAIGNHFEHGRSFGRRSTTSSRRYGHIGRSHQ